MNEQSTVTLHLPLKLQYLRKTFPIFIEMMSRFLENQDDPTGMRVCNPRRVVQCLRRTFELTDGLLGVLDQLRDPGFIEVQGGSVCMLFNKILSNKEGEAIVRAQPMVRGPEPAKKCRFICANI